MNHSLSSVPGLPDDFFAHDGLITKRIIRAAALAHLRPLPRETLWDLGVGAGSILVEWLRAEPTATGVGVERRADRLANAAANITRFGLDERAQLITGEVAQTIPQLPPPDAIFIGGGLSSDVAELCLTKLPSGGRFVAHGVTIEAEARLTELHKAHGGELTRMSVEVSDKIGSFRGWKPLRTVVQWAYLA